MANIDFRIADALAGSILIKKIFPEGIDNPVYMCSEMLTITALTAMTPMVRISNVLNPTERMIGPANGILRSEFERFARNLEMYEDHGEELLLGLHDKNPKCIEIICAMARTVVKIKSSLTNIKKLVDEEDMFNTTDPDKFMVISYFKHIQNIFKWIDNHPHDGYDYSTNGYCLDSIKPIIDSF